MTNFRQCSIGYVEVIDWLNNIREKSHELKIMKKLESSSRKET